jgi:HAE1 family hydrophobic/amphiphilic exporter-1
MARSSGGLSFVTRRPVAITMFMVAIGVFGIVSLQKLPVDLLPEISYPTLTVRTTYEGAAPEDVEDRISERIQEALSTLPNLVRSTSISRAETSDVVLEFDWGTRMTFAVQDVRDKLDAVFLPQGADRPLILRYDPNLDPILRIGLVTPEEGRARDPVAQLVHLRWIAENRVKRELEAMPGVAAVLVRGGLEEEIRVRVDPFLMAAQNLDPGVLAARLAQENINASGGMIREGSTDYLVRTLNEFRDLAEIEDLAVERRGEATIRVRDVATVERTHAEREVISRLDGGESVEIAVYREAGANIVELAETVRTRIFGDEEQQKYAAELEQKGEDGATGTWGDRDKTDFLGWRFRNEAEFATLSDQSTFISAAVNEVKSSAVLGALLAVLVIWVFLRQMSATLIIGVAIPISVIVTFAPMYISGVSLNIMSLGGLALGVGMLVDNAIVVLESITRCREEGDDLADAAVRGVREVAGAIVASTLTTIAVFAPIVFVHGIAGQIFGDQALTVVTSLLVSLLVAVLFIPMLASRPALAGGGWQAMTRLATLSGAPAALAGSTLEAGEPRDAQRPPRFFEGMTLRSWSAVFPTLLLFVGRSILLLLFLVVRGVGAVIWSLGKTLWVLSWPVRFVFDRGWALIEAIYPRLLSASLSTSWLVIGAAGLLFAVSLQRIERLGVELLPEIHQGEFTAHVALGVGSPIEVTDEVLGDIDRRVRALDGVEVTALTVGVEKDTLTREIEGNHTARLTVRMYRAAASAESEEALIAATRRVLADHPAIQTVDISRPTPFALDAPVTVEVLGHDLADMGEVAADVHGRIANIDGLTDVRTSLRPGHPEARITFDRDKTLEYGLDLATVSNFVRDQVLGNVSTRFNEGEERIDVRVMGDEVILSNLERVLDLVVNPDAETPVRLRSVAAVERVQGPAEIRRIGNTRAVVLTAAGTGLDLGGLTSRIETGLGSLVTPDEVTVQLGGQKREMELAQSSMRFALLLALFLVYVVMACQFESLVQPLIILVTAPLALIGVVFVLDFLGVSLSVVVFIGMIMLSGIVVNNAIVLIDRINQRRAAGVPLREAVIEGGRARLRPILMTTGTTVTGLLPLTGWLTLPSFDAPIVEGGGPQLFATALRGLSEFSNATGAGAEIRAPMAITVIAGLTVATLLTLVVIPVVYYLVARILPGPYVEAKT